MTSYNQIDSGDDGSEPPVNLSSIIVSDANRRRTLVAEVWGVGHWCMVKDFAGVQGAECDGVLEEDMEA